MTDEKVVQLAEKYFTPSKTGFIHKDGVGVAIVISDVRSAEAAIREACDVGRRDGLEEAAKILKEMTDELSVLKNAVGDTERGRGLQKGVWAMFAAQLKISNLAEGKL